MKNIFITAFVFLMALSSTVGQTILNDGRPGNVVAKTVVVTEDIKSSSNKDVYKGSDQDDPNAQAKRAEQDLIFPMDFNALKNSIKKSLLNENVEERLDALSQQIYDLTLFNEQLRIENNDIKRSMEECCEASKGDQSFLIQNTPNPASDYTEISYYLSQQMQSAAIIIRDSEGKKVATYDLQESGYHSVDLSSQNLAAGYYFYTLYEDNKVKDSKVLIFTR